MDEEPAAHSDRLGLLETGQHHEWPSAEVLKAFLGRHPSVVRGRRVLELGSGLGTCGMAAAEAGASEVIFTDAEEAEPVLARLRALTREIGSGAGDAARTRFDVRGFTWGKLPSFVLDSNMQSPHVLLAADCLYDSTQLEDFVASVGFFLHRDPASVLLMTYHLRSESRNIGSLLLEYGLQACIVPLGHFLNPADAARLSSIELSIITAST